MRERAFRLSLRVRMSSGATSLAAHFGVLLSIAYCATPTQYIPSLRPTSRATAPERLVYVTSPGRIDNVASRREVTSQSSPASQSSPSALRAIPSRSFAPNTIDTVTTPRDIPDEVPASANTGAKVNTPVHTSASGGVAQRDSAAAPTSYFAPVHPALRGLVPDERSMAILGSPMKLYTQPTALPPRPTDCTAGFFQCTREMLKWRTDSAIFAALQCREGKRRTAPLSMIERLRGVERPAIADSSCAR